MATLLLAAVAAPATHAQAIQSAHYEMAVERYGHYAAGRPHEYARLVVNVDNGHSLSFQLAHDEVFEDIAPRVVSLGEGPSARILAVVSRRHDGARLVLFRVQDNTIEISAESAAIGTPMRWLNPVGVADLDGDGRPEIAAVTTPHIGGTLRIYRVEGKKLAEVAALSGFSNHALGSSELGLSTPVDIGRGMRLVVPDTTRRLLRVVALHRDRLVETARCELPTQVSGAIEPVATGEVLVGLGSQKIRVRLDRCRPAEKPGNSPRM